MSLDGFIFDVDGTLVDSNDFHVQAWQCALAEKGFNIAADRIYVEVGKGGDNLVPALLGRQAAKKHEKALGKAETREFKKIIARQGLKPFARAADLLTDLRRRKIKLAIATSSDQDILQAIEKASKTKWTSLVDVTVTADDAARSKPNPDLIAVALKKLKLSPGQCAFLGDTPHDAQAALSAGVVCLGVQSGGHTRQTLLQSACRLVYRDTADLLKNLDAALRAASPGKIPLTQKLLEDLMHRAIQIARDGMAAGEAPIGCVIANGAGQIIATGYNRLNHSANKTAHAEMVAFAAAAGKVPLDARDLLLISTLEPCVMCTGAAMEAAIDTIAFGLPAPPDQGTHRVNPPASPESQMPRIIGRILPQKCRDLFKDWLATNPSNPKQVQYIKQLLDQTKTMI